MAILSYIVKVMYNQVVMLTFLIIIFTVSGCSEQEKPPYFTAQVVNVYNEKTVVKNFKLLYWWEERGETPFLKPYTFHTKELIVETMIPFKDNPKRVTIKTERIPLQNIDSISIVLTEVGKDIKITLKNGKEVLATNRFPRVLKKGEKTGLADYKIFAEGIVVEGKEKSEFKLELNMIKHIKILQIDHT